MKNFNIIVTTAVLLIVYAILFSGIGFQKYTYKMVLLIKTPENSEMTIKECESTNKNFQCRANYVESLCVQKGNYFGKAITYRNSRVLSQTGWSVLNDFCKQAS